MISHEHKAIFIHINRTGGCSIESAFSSQLMDHRFPADYRKIVGDEYENYFKFCFIRNPWDRYVSIFSFRKKIGVIEQTKDFNDWLFDYVKDPCAPQLDWIKENGKLAVDFIGKFERLSWDFDHVCKRIGFNNSLPHVNRSGHKHYGSYYTTATRDLVSKINKEDIELFNYRFECKVL